MGRAGEEAVMVVSGGGSRDACQVERGAPKLVMDRDARPDARMMFCNSSGGTTVGPVQQQSGS
jgi:hypothetical protein